MASTPYRSFSRARTPQSEPIPGETQVQNNAGGYVYALDPWAQMRRFLILGTEGGTYYVGEQKLTRENAVNVLARLREDGQRAVQEIVRVSDEGRAPKNDPAVFALALAASDPNPATRKTALDALPLVCRIPTHLFQFLIFVRQSRGWGRGLRRAVQDWYARWTPEQLAYEIVKYQSREGWTHGDVWRMAHPRLTPEVQGVLRWALEAGAGARQVARKSAGRTDTYAAVTGDLPSILAAFEEAKTASMGRLIMLIREHGLTREMVPSQHLQSPEVWDALLERMPLTAMIRNLGKMTEVGLLRDSLSPAVSIVTQRLADQAYLRKSRVHPLNVLNALRTYAQGHGEKGKLTWTPVSRVSDALDAAFYLAFGNVESTGKPVLLALDVSGSMIGSRIAGTAISAREASAALALVTAATEPEHAIVGFTNGGVVSGRSQWPSFQSGISPLDISPRKRLDDVVRYIEHVSFGGTDCALPMIYAQQEKVAVEAFVIYTDDETWAGDVHPSEAVREYRRTMQRPHAACVVVGMTATGFSIADPHDPRMLDVVGFDLGTPQAITEFVRA